MDDQIQDLLIADVSVILFRQVVADLHGTVTGVRVGVLDLFEQILVLAFNLFMSGQSSDQIIQMRGKTAVVEAFSVDLDMELLLDDLRTFFDDLCRIGRFLLPGVDPVGDKMHRQGTRFHSRQLLSGHLLDDLQRVQSHSHLIRIELVQVLQQRRFQIDVLVFPFDRELQMIGQGDGGRGREIQRKLIRYIVDDVDGSIDDDSRDVADDPIVGILDVVESPVDRIQRDLFSCLVEADALAKSDDFSSFRVDAVGDVVVDVLDKSIINPIIMVLKNPNRFSK